MSLACIPRDIICNPYTFFFLRVSICPKSGENRVSFTCYSQSSFLALLYITISNVTGVLQYTRITALCNTSVIFLAVQNNYLQGQICLSLILRLSSRKRFQLR